MLSNNNNKEAGLNENGNYSNYEQRSNDKDGFSVLDASVQQGLISSLMLDKPKTPPENMLKGEYPAVGTPTGNNSQPSDLSSMVNALTPTQHGNSPSHGENNLDNKMESSSLGMNDILLSDNNSNGNPNGNNMEMNNQPGPIRHGYNHMYNDNSQYYNSYSGPNPSGGSVHNQQHNENSYGGTNGYAIPWQPNNYNGPNGQNMQNMPTNGFNMQQPYNNPPMQMNNMRMNNQYYNQPGPHGGYNHYPPPPNGPGGNNQGGPGNNRYMNNMPPNNMPPNPNYNHRYGNEGPYPPPYNNDFNGYNNSYDYHQNGNNDYHGRNSRSGKNRNNDYDNRNQNRHDDRHPRNSNRENNNVVRDTLVEEFRQTYGKTRQWELTNIQNHIVAFCQDQHGSRFIQQRLEIASPSEKQLVFDEIIPYAISLMTDVFGNYVIQKLFEYGLPPQCETLASLLMGQSVTLSMQMYGCRVIQKALEYVSKERLIALVSEFNGPQLIKCVHDQNGNHVIQKCIEIVSRVAKEAPTQEESDYLSNRILFILTAFKGQVQELSMHPYGCRVIQRILEHCANVHKQAILDELKSCSVDLIQDQYGNYVIQHVMQHGYEPDRNVLVKEVQEHLLEFSQHKFASNVVEKCLQYANKRDRDDMIWTIINVTFDMNSPVDAKTGHCVLESMVRDPYANYVVQKVLDVSDERQRAAILRYVKENIVQLRRYTYGKHIIVRLEKIMNEKF